MLAVVVVHRQTDRHVQLVKMTQFDRIAHQSHRVVVVAGQYRTLLLYDFCITREEGGTLHH